MAANTPSHILLIEAYTDANIGSGALVENSLNLLKQRYPDAAFRVMAHDPQAFVDLYGLDAVPNIFAFPLGQPRMRQLGWAIVTCWWMLIVYLQALLPGRRVIYFRERVQDLEWADMVVSVGAERINDKFVVNIVFSLYLYMLAKRLRRPVVLFPCSIGPFLYGWTRRLSARYLRNLDLIYTRDDMSLHITRDTLDVPDTIIVNTSDVAVMQARISREEAHAMLGIAEGEPIVGISVMHWTYVGNKAETPYSNYESYAREMARFADAIIAQYGVRVVFFPTNFPVHGCREDDVTTAREIYAQMTQQARASIIDTLPSPAQFKGMLACAEVNITTRMHACILSTGAGVPTMSVNYLFKLSEYMRSLGLQYFAIDIEDFNADWALAAFQRMWTERAHWRAVIEAAIARKQQQLLAAMERLDALVS